MNTETENSNTGDKARNTKSKNRSTAKKPSTTKSAKSNTEAKPASPWSVRGVDLETRQIIDRAASKQNKHLGEYFNQDIREFCTGQIKKSQIPPASPNDVKDMVNAELTVFKADILAAMAAMSQKEEPERKSFSQKLRDLFR